MAGTVADPGGRSACSLRLSLFGLWLIAAACWLHLALLAAVRGGCWRWTLWRARAGLAPGLARCRAVAARAGQRRRPPAAARARRSRCRGISRDPGDPRLWAMHRQRLMRQPRAAAARAAALRPAAPRSLGVARRSAAGAGRGPGPRPRRASARACSAASTFAGRRAVGERCRRAGRSVDHAAGLYPPRAAGGEQTRGVAHAGGADRQRGAGCRPTIWPSRRRAASSFWASGPRRSKRPGPRQRRGRA